MNLPNPDGRDSLVASMTAEEKARLRSELHRFALWMSDVWDEDNEDDVDASLAWVDHFLAGGDRG